MNWKQYESATVDILQSYEDRSTSPAVKMMELNFRFQSQSKCDLFTDLRETDEELNGKKPAIATFFHKEPTANISAKFFNQFNYTNKEFVPTVSQSRPNMPDSMKSDQNKVPGLKISMHKPIALTDPDSDRGLFPDEDLAIDFKKFPGNTLESVNPTKLSSSKSIKSSRVDQTRKTLIGLCPTPEALIHHPVRRRFVQTDSGDITKDHGQIRSNISKNTTVTKVSLIAA